MSQDAATEIWLTITNVRLRAKSEKATVEVQVQGDAGEAADSGPKWLECVECTGEPGITADKLYDKIFDALKENRKVRGRLGFGSENRVGKLVIWEVEVRYQ